MIDEDYTDWLIYYFRRQNQTEKLLVKRYLSIVSSNLNHMDQNPSSFKFFQFISFTWTQTATIKIFGTGMFQNGEPGFSVLNQGKVMIHS